MGVKYSTLVWEESRQQGTALVVMLALADAANNHGHGIAWPKQAELAKQTRLKPRQLRNVLAKLEDEGELVKIEDGRGRGHRCYYGITLPPYKSEEKEAMRCRFMERLKEELGCRFSSADRDRKAAIQRTQKRQSKVKKASRILIHEPEGNQKEEKSAPAAVAAEPAADTPKSAKDLFRSVMNCYPREVFVPNFEEALARVGPDRFTYTLKCWLGAAHNPKNYGGMLDWLNGQIPDNRHLRSEPYYQEHYLAKATEGKNGNGHHEPPIEQQLPKTFRQIRDERNRRNDAAARELSERLLRGETTLEDVIARGRATDQKRLGHGDPTPQLPDGSPGHP